MAADKHLFGRFARDAVLSFASLGISSFVHFLLRVFLARYVGPTDLGLYTLSYSAYSFGVIFAAFGIGGALVKYVAESKDDSSRMGGLLFIGVIASFSIGCIMWLALHFSSPWVARSFFKMDAMSGLLQIVAFSFPFIALEKATLGFLNGMRRMTLYAFVNVYQNVLTALLTIALVLLGYGVKGAVVALVLPIVLLSLFSLFATRKYLSRPTQDQMVPILGVLLKYGVLLLMGSSMFMLFENVDKVLLGHYMDADAVGIYSAAAILSVIVSLIPSSIVMVTGPATASYWARGELGSIQDLVNRVTRYTAVIIVPISFAGLLLSRELITLIFEEPYVSATVPLQILLAGYLFGGIFASVSTALTMTRWVQMAFVFGAVQVAINAALCTVLIPRFGMNGASASTAATLVFGTLLNVYFGRRFLKISVDWGWLARFLTVSAAVFAGGYGLGLVVSPYICVVAGLAILAFVIVRYFLTAEDREMIRRLVPLGRRSS